MPNLLDRLTESLADRYRLERPLGRGGMATVYLAKDLKHDRLVALKVLRPELAASLGTGRFVQEIQMAAQLNHPHILPLYDSGDAGDVMYYVMPYVQGESLSDKLDREKQLAIDDALSITHQVASGLDYAHRQGIVHRDIKPQNILLHEGDAMIADFGIALAVQTAAAERMTETGLALGTPEYMSPEQATGARELDARCDVYALGCVLYEMLAGEPPYTGPTAQAVIGKCLGQPIPRLRAVRTTVPEHVERAVLKALAKAPVDRFLTVAEFAHALSTPETLSVAFRPTSIVVLPFANLSPDPDNEYFSTGLTEEIITDLSKVRALRVISRNSAMQLKDTTKNTRSIGRELNVQYVLEGSVRRAGTSLRVTAQLIDATSDTHVWADKFTGTLEDVFGVQERLSRSIVAALEIALSPDEDRGIAEQPLLNVHAYECYHRARHHIWRLGGPGYDRALELIESGLEIGGDNELLFAAQGQVFLQYVLWGIKQDRATYLAKAAECAEKVARLNPQSPFRFALPAQIHYLQGSRQQAADEFKRALSIDPNDPDILVWLISLYGRAGHAAPARPLVQRLLELDPLTPITHQWPGWFDLVETGDVESNLRSCRKVYQMDMQSPYGRFVYSVALALAEHVEESVNMLQLIERDTPDHGFARLGSMLKQALRGNKEAALRARTDELVRWAETDDTASWCMADCYGLVGEAEEAGRWIANAATRGGFNYPMSAKNDPLLGNVRSDPRFQEVLRDVRRRWEAFMP